MGVPCENHKALEKDIEHLQDQVDELKEIAKCHVTSESLQLTISNLEREVADLKKDNQQHFANSNSISKTLEQISTTNEFLKEAISDNRLQTEKLMDKLDQMYQLLLNFKSPQGDIKAKNNIEKDEAQMYKGVPSERTDIMTYVKDNKLAFSVILLLVVLVIFLITGKWMGADLWLS